MTDEFNAALKDYQAKWSRLIEARSDKDFFKEFKPTATGWKVTDRAEHDRIVAGLRDKCDLVDSAWMDGRWITVLHFKDTALAWGITVIKVMERRPGSSDPVGLDHVDFYSPAAEQADDTLKAEPALDWRHETNGAHWISLRWESTEAKLRTDTVLDSYIRDLRECRNGILKKAL